MSEKREKIYRGHVMHCGSQEPHASHVLGRYTTVRWGSLQRFCLGTPPPQGETLNVECLARGSAEAPTVYRVIDQ